MRRKIPMTLPLVILVAFSCLLLPTSSAQAAPVAFAFRGRVDRVFDGMATLSPRVVAGAPFRGIYIFDSTTPNTAEPVDEGQRGLYHHDRPPAGVLVNVGGMTFFSTLRRPNFDILVNNDFGFTGADEYGFFSYNNRSVPQVRGDLLQINWFASTFMQQVFSNVDLPLDPPDLSRLGGGEFKIYGECTPCASPSAFFSITGPVTSLVKVGAGTGWQADGFSMPHIEKEWANDATWGALVPEPQWASATAVWITIAWICRRPHTPS